MDCDERFMKKAISLAKRGLGSTFPNPVVGALLVKDDIIILLTELDVNDFI